MEDKKRTWRDVEVHMQMWKCRERNEEREKQKLDRVESVEEVRR